MNRLTCLIALLVANVAFAQTTVPTTGPVKAALDREVAHLKAVAERLEKYPRLKANPYTRLELALAQRFIERVSKGKGKGDPEPVMKLLEMDEVGVVLKHTEKTMNDIDAGRLPPEGLGPVPVPTGGPVTIVDGVFETETIIPADPTPKRRPFYFGGYGHFQQIVEDLPNFSELSVTLVQDGRNGPNQGLAKDRTLTAAGLDIKTTLDKAAKANVKIDILTSPHYFPAWAVDESPDMQNGLPYQNVDHPVACGVIEKWLTLVAQQNKSAPALLSYCLSNEPMYSTSGRDKHGAPAWHAFLKERHKTIENLNKLYEKDYKSFEEVPADGWKDDNVGRRHAFDWVSFNDQHFAGWHKWMGDVLKKQDPRALTHAKIMIFFALDHDKAGWGIDPEQFALATDIAGCDAYSQMGVGVGPLDESASDEYAYHWQVEQMCYDLLHSFANQPVFNSENHPIPNATGAYRYPAKQARATIWQGGLHHQSATTTWVWEEANDPSLLHSIYYRPAYCWGHQRALLDLNRLSAEVTAINRAEPTVAILYSPASRFWQPDYGKTVRTAYTALNFLGETITFVSERQLAEKKVSESIRAIVVPHATHVQRSTIDALFDFVTPPREARNQVIAIGEDSLAFDEYHRESALAKMRDQRAVVAKGNGVFPAVIPVAGEKETRDALAKALPPRQVKAEITVDGKPAWGIEFRVVEHQKGWLAPVINHLKEAQTVDISIEHGEDQAIDLLTGQVVSLRKLKLEPMVPLLLKMGWH